MAKPTHFHIMMHDEVLPDTADFQMDIAGTLPDLASCLAAGMIQLIALGAEQDISEEGVIQLINMTLRAQKQWTELAKKEVRKL